MFFVRKIKTALSIKKLVKLILVTTIIIALIIIGFYQSVNFGFFGEIYSKEAISNFKNEQAGVVYSEDEIIIGKFYNVNRTNVSYSEFPSHLISALVATEDARYFDHEGVDSKSLLRVVIKSLLLNDKSSGGGSTITQQLAKNMYGRKSFGILTMPVNKCKEIILASRIESLYNKKEILALYLNTVPFGENVYGIEAAAKRFFNKSVSNLKIQESAILIGMLKANSFYNPRLYPQNAVKRRATVFNQLFKYEYINKEVLDSLNQFPIELNYTNLKSEGVASYYLVQVKNEAQKIIEEINIKSGEHYSLEKDGLIIKTTLNHSLQIAVLNAFKVHLSKMQKLLRQQYERQGDDNSLMQAVNRSMQKLNLKNDTAKITELFSWDGMFLDSISVRDSLKHELSTLQAGFLALSPKNGAVKAYVGGIDYLTQPYDQILAKRQIASTFKPILYATAIENGRMPCDYIDNSSFTLSDHEGWSPQNYDKKEEGKYSLAAALSNSKNLPTVRLFFETEFKDLDYLWKKLGFSSDLKEEPSTSLGTVTASVKEIAKAYACFANGGHKIDSYCVESITTKSGKIIYAKQKGSETIKLMNEKTIVLINEILQKAIKEGTGKPLRKRYGVKLPLAGKTGTAQSYSDAWFVCYNPAIVIVSRVGANLPSIHFDSGNNGSGGNLALPLTAITLQQVQNNNRLKSILLEDFDELPKELANALDCQDYKEDSIVEQFFDQFRKKETTLEKAQRKAKRKKKNPFRKLF